MLAIPAGSRWIFWDVDPDAIDLERDADGVLARVLERGCLSDVKWLPDVYGLERIREVERKWFGSSRAEREQRFIPRSRCPA